MPVVFLEFLLLVKQVDRSQVSLPLLLRIGLAFQGKLKDFPFPLPSFLQKLLLVDSPLIVDLHLPVFVMNELLRNPMLCEVELIQRVLGLLHGHVDVRGGQLEKLKGS